MEKIFQRRMRLSFFLLSFLSLSLFLPAISSLFLLNDERKKTEIEGEKKKEQKKERKEEERKEFVT